MSRKLACIILAAGKGTRMKSALPKPLHAVAGMPMVNHVLTSAESLSPEKIVVVIGNDMPEMAEAVKPHTTVIQKTPNGTGGAALAAKEALSGFDGDVLILFADMPLMTTDTMQRMIDLRRQLPSIGVVFSAMQPENPGSYGRMVMGDDGTLDRIVEFKDATPEQKKITLCNGGVVCADGQRLFDWLEQITPNNAQGEYYLTDLPQMARRDNLQSHILEVPAQEMEGANTRADLARLERLMQNRLREQAMLNGATLIDPDTVYLSIDTEIGQDVVIEPNVFIGRNVRIGNNVTIHAYSHLEGASISDDAQIGPFARLRPGSNIGRAAKIGNFVETKNTHLGAGAKASHLTYLGDADIGDKANIGAGTITCNYDGFLKHKTVIGADSFIGSNTALVAPVTIGHGAFVGAGSTITENVPDNALGITRAPQLTKENWAPEYKQKKMKQKAKQEG